MKVPLLDLKIQYQQIKEEILQITQEIYNSQIFILGPKVDEFEKKAAEYCRCPYALGVSSGTDAILITLMAEGIEPGDMVITTPYTFFATAGCIARLGAIPVFVDIDEKTYNIDPLKIEARISRMNRSEKTQLKAIMPVHLYGQCAEMEPVCELAKTYGLTVIEDAAQAIGSEYQYGSQEKRAGSMGQYGCFSFFPSKNLGAFGDAGLVTSNSKENHEKLKILRVHGSAPKYYHKFIGGNFRIDALQAAILSVKLKYLDAWTKRRQENAALYREYFKQADINDDVILPYSKEKRHIYNQFVIKVKNKRDQLKTFLTDRGIGTEIYYPVPLHLQECFKFFGYQENDFPIAESAAKKTLALPIFPELTTDQIHYVVDNIKDFTKK